MSTAATRNILLITTDQQRFDTIAAAGAHGMRTPHLDWLCHRGIRFSRAYTDAPICSPSRYTLLTGRHTWQQQPNFSAWGRPAALDRRYTLPGLFSAAGWQTRAIGKMHIGREHEHLGWEHVEFLSDYFRWAREHGQSPMDTGLGQNEYGPAISSVTERYSSTRWIADRFGHFLDDRDLSRPFLCQLNFSKPHPPFDPPAAYWELYRDADLPAPVRGDWSQQASDVPSGFSKATWMLSSGDKFAPDHVRQLRRSYAALITHIDYALGHVFARLRETQQLNHTTIIFTSDHGDMLGDHHLWAKEVLFEGAARVPLIVLPASENRANTVRPGTMCPHLSCLADIVPTVVADAGITLPPHLTMDGLDLLAVAQGTLAPRKTLHGECYQYHAVWDGPYAYLWCALGGSELLFNVDTDPLQQHELLRTGTMSDVHQRLRQLMIERLHHTGNPYQRDGKLIPVACLDERDVRGTWPGFHTWPGQYGTQTVTGEVCH